MIPARRNCASTVLRKWSLVTPLAANGEGRSSTATLTPSKSRRLWRSRESSSDAALTVSSQLRRADRQLPDALTGGRKDRVSDRGNDLRIGGLTRAAGPFR